MTASYSTQPLSLRRAVGGAFPIGQPIEQRVEILEPRVDDRRLIDRARDRLQRLVAVAGYRHDHGLVGLDAPLLHQLERDRERGAAGGLGENSLSAREQ